jgi:condensation domain-containing protein
MTVPVHHVDRFFLFFEDPPPVTCGWAFALEGGSVEPKRLRRAVDEALARQPKAAARLRRDGGRLTWEASPTPGERAWQPEAPLDGASEYAAESLRVTAIMSSPLDPEQGPLVRVHWIPAGAFRARLVFRFHHALSDGAGSLVFLREMLDAYNGRSAPPVPPGEATPLVTGNAPSKAGLLARLVSLHARRSGAHWFAWPARLYDRKRRPNGQLAHAGRSIPPDRLARLRAAARARGAGLTEMLLAAVALAADRLAAEGGRRCGVLRIAVTQDLRSRRGEVSRLENRSSAFPVWIGPADRRRPDRLVRELHRQVHECLRSRIAAANAVVAEALRLPAPVARRLLLPAGTSARVADSCAFANLGALPAWTADGSGWFHLGGGRVVGARAVVRPGEGLGAIATAVLLDGTLELGLSYLGGLFETAEAERYVALADAALDELAALESAPAISD